MDLGLEGARALVTGGSKGIGLAAAQALAAEGCVVELAARSPESLVMAADAIEHATGARPGVHAVDLATAAGRESLGAALRGCDILVNNAGAIPGGGFEQIGEEHWRRAWDLKVFGYIEATRIALGAMLERRSGAIVNVIGLAAVSPRYDYLCGATGNAALAAFSKAVSGHAGRHGVRVTGINPGPTETDRLVGLYEARAEAAFGDRTRWRELLADLPFGRLPAAADIGAIIAFLASPRATYLSGAVIDADGGARYQ